MQLKKKARTDLNHMMQLTRIPGHEGAYRSFELSLCEQLSTMVSINVLCTCILILACMQQISQDATSFQPNQKIKVRISGDGAKFSWTSSFVLLSYTILMPVGRYLSGIGINLNMPVTQ